ncbi:MAG: DUF790 family protein [Deltaproteobacteria bacterium]|nr:DUF790 family protein [Deltaproteobacteria bacterium]
MRFLPEKLLDVAVRDGQIVARYLTDRDRAWIEALRDAVEAAVGLPRAEVEDRLAMALAVGGGLARRALSAFLLGGWYGYETAAAVDPRRLREVVFVEAGRAGPAAERRDVMARAAASLGIGGTDAERALFADLPAARRLVAEPSQPSTPDLIERYNLALAQGLLLRAQRVRVAVSSGFKAVLRYARLARLVSVVEPDRAGGGVIVRVEGPLSLFRVTTKYGLALASWLPALTRAPGWRLVADVVVRGRRARYAASHHDPIGSTHAEPRRFDSAVEEALFRGLARVAPRWHVLREADPVQVGGRVLCPDFTVEDPAAGVRVPVEVVGFWTPEYLADKVSVAASLPPDARWVLCIDEDLCDRAGPLPEGPVLRFRRRIDPVALAALLEEVTMARSDRSIR